MPRFAICNETFGDERWDRVCELVASIGYEGIEIAPFTFAPSVTEISPARRRWIREVALGNGLAIVALHWLLVSPPGLHVHTRDEVVRRKTVAYLRDLTDFAGDIGAPVMVLGSPAQRRLEDADAAGARERTRESLRELLPTLEERGVALCLEALPRPEADFILTAAEAAAIVRGLDHPNLRLMLDVRAMCSEGRQPADLVREYAPLLEHVHANDATGRGPGFGATDFRPIAAALRESGCRSCVSVEVFDHGPDPETIALESLAYLRSAFAERAECVIFRDDRQA